MAFRSLVTGPKRCEVGAGLLEAQYAVWSATNPFRILIVLTIVLPETDGADLVPASFVEGEAVTTRAPETEPGLRRMHDRIGGEFAAVVFKPLLSGALLRRRRLLLAGHAGPANVPPLSSGRIHKRTSGQVATSEPVVHHHGREGGTYGSRLRAAVCFNGLLARQRARLRQPSGPTASSKAACILSRTSPRVSAIKPASAKSSASQAHQAIA